MKSMVRILSGLICILAISTGCNTGAEGANGGSARAGLFLYAPPSANTFHLRQFITVVVENHTDHPVLLAPTGLKLLVKDAGQWKQVDNIVSNSIPRNVLLYPRFDANRSAMTIPVIPKITQAGIAFDFRVEISGVDQVTGEEVAGSTEMKLSP